MFTNQPRLTQVNDVLVIRQTGSTSPILRHNRTVSPNRDNYSYFTSHSYSGPVHNYDIPDILRAQTRREIERAEAQNEARLNAERIQAQARFDYARTELEALAQP